MESSRRTVHVEKRASRRMVALISAAAIFVWLCTASTSEAKPQINIIFYGRRAAARRFFTCIGWGPAMERITRQTIFGPISPTPAATCCLAILSRTKLTTSSPQLRMPIPCRPPLPQARKATVLQARATVILNVSGDWNGASCGPEACASLDHEKRVFYVQTDRPRPAFAASFVRPQRKSRSSSLIWTREMYGSDDALGWQRDPEAAIWCPVWAGRKRAVPGEPKKCDVWLYLANATPRVANWHIGYALLKKTDPINGHVIPVKTMDSQGRMSACHCLEHNGSLKYPVAAHTALDNAIVVKDLQINYRRRWYWAEGLRLS